MPWNRLDADMSARMMGRSSRTDESDPFRYNSIHAPGQRIADGADILDTNSTGYQTKTGVYHLGRGGTGIDSRESAGSATGQPIAGLPKMTASTVGGFSINPVWIVAGLAALWFFRRKK